MLSPQEDAPRTGVRDGPVPIGHIGKIQRSKLSVPPARRRDRHHLRPDCHRFEILGRCSGGAPADPSVPDLFVRPGRHRPVPGVPPVCVLAGPPADGSGGAQPDGLGHGVRAGHPCQFSHASDRRDIPHVGGYLVRHDRPDAGGRTHRGLRRAGRRARSRPEQEARVAGGLRRAGA
ncbi:hypothetical protein D3C78_1255910 [compost metagenome]